jgi:16S rRNA processing protein RimM
LSKLVPIGAFSKPHGLKGELKVFLYNQESETLVPGISIWISKSKKDSYMLDSVRGSKKNFIVKIENINTREEAAIFVKKEIFVMRDDFPEIDEGFYLDDIIGFKITDDKNNNLGILEDIITSTGSEILVIKYQDYYFYHLLF